MHEETVKRVPDCAQNPDHKSEYVARKCGICGCNILSGEVEVNENVEE